MGGQGVGVRGTAGRASAPAPFDPRADPLPLVDGLTMLALVGIVAPPRPQAKAARETVAGRRATPSGASPVEVPVEPGRLRGVVELRDVRFACPNTVGEPALDGIAVTVATSGEPRPLSPVVGQAAYRILQEALTNASRHGDGRVRVDVAFTEETVALVVSNDVAGSTAAPTAGGHGLVGMRERAELVGGTFDAGRVNGSFRLRAELRYQGGAG